MVTAKTIYRAYEILENRKSVLTPEEVEILKRCIDYADDVYTTQVKGRIRETVAKLDFCESCESFSNENCCSCPYNPHVYSVSY